MTDIEEEIEWLEGVIAEAKRAMFFPLKQQAELYGNRILSRLREIREREKQTGVWPG